MISDNLQRLQDSNTRIKSNIANAYLKAEEKGAELPSVQNSDNLVETIESIPQASSGWQPELDWWDIDKILAEDTEDYPAKMICLLTDGKNELKFNFNLENKVAKVKTSDGAEYTSTATHTWDKTKDKQCSLGYKTRYYICYFNTQDIMITPSKLPLNGVTGFSYLYIIFSNANIKSFAERSTGIFGSNILLEGIKLINSTITDSGGYTFLGNNNLKYLDASKISLKDNIYTAFQNCLSLKNIDGINILNVTNARGAFIGSLLTYIPKFDTSAVENFYDSFSGCKLLRAIECLDFSSATNVSNMFYNCTSLTEIKEIKNIKIGGLSFSACTLLNHDTLLRILNALYDYSEDTENRHSIALGATNLAKLTDEELAIGQNKGWTIS